MPKIMDTHVGQRAPLAERIPPIVDVDGTCAGLVRENVLAVFALLDPFEDFHRLAVEPDGLGSGLAVGQKKAGPQSHSRSRISPTRAPVKISRRVAATCAG